MLAQPSLLHSPQRQGHKHVVAVIGITVNVTGVTVTSITGITVLIVYAIDVVVVVDVSASISILVTMAVEIIVGIIVDECTSIISTSTAAWSVVTVLMPMSMIMIVMLMFAILAIMSRHIHHNNIRKQIQRVNHKPLLCGCE